MYSLIGTCKLNDINPEAMYGMFSNVSRNTRSTGSRSCCRGVSPVIFLQPDWQPDGTQKERRKVANPLVAGAYRAAGSHSQRVEADPHSRGSEAICTSSYWAASASAPVILSGPMSSSSSMSSAWSSVMPSGLSLAVSSTSMISGTAGSTWRLSRIPMPDILGRGCASDALTDRTPGMRSAIPSGEPSGSP